MDLRKSFTCILAVLYVLVAPSLWAQNPSGTHRTLSFDVSLPSDVRTERDLVFARYGERALALDLYHHADTIRLRPLIVWIHGGTWSDGDKTNVNPALPLLERGYQVASISYRFSQDAVFPAQIIDAKAAVRWLRAHAAHYGIDPDRIGVFGESAGGYLAALLGTAGEKNEWEQGDHLNESSRVQAVCDWFGPTDLLQMGVWEGTDHNLPDSPASRLIGGPVQENKDKAREANPMTYITADDPPFLIMHGLVDPIVPVRQSGVLHRALFQAGVQSDLMLIQNLGHTGPAWKDQVRHVTAFFEKVLPPEK